MLIKARNILGLRIVTLADGKEIEKVKEIIYDPDEHKVKALLIDDGGIFSEAKVIPFDQIKSIGEDAVIVLNGQSVRKASEVTQKVSDIAKHGSYLTNTKIITESGKELGQVTDILFDSNTGVVEEFIVSQGGITDIKSGQKTVRVADIVTIGKDATIVKAFTEDTFKEQAQTKGLQGTMETIKDKSSEIIDKAKEKTPTKDDLRYQWTMAKNAATDKSTELKDNPETQTKVQEAKDNLHTVTNKLQNAVQNTVESTKQNIATVRNNLDNERKKSVAGQYLTKNIVISNNNILAKRGDMVTFDLIDAAETNGVADEVFANVSKQPVS